MKQLIVNADDFGFTRDVNAGIVECYRSGILTATTLMANGPAFEDAVRLSRENPGLDIGCHLVLVGSPGFPPTVPQLVKAVTLKRIPIYAELVKQVRTILTAGLHPTHLDTHKHTHLLPPVLDAVARISEEFSIPWVRRPFDFPVQANGVGLGKRMVSQSLTVVRGRFARVLAAHHCRTTDHFAGFRLTGRYDAQELWRLIAQLPDGTTEFMCHPGYCTDDLRSSKTRLKASREQELHALTSPQVKAALRLHEVRLTSYAEYTPM